MRLFEREARAWVKVIAVVAVLGACISASVSADAPGPFTIWMGQAGYSDTSTLQDLFKKIYGFDFKIEWTQGDVNTAVNLKLASGGFDDLAGFWNSDVIRAAMVKANAVQAVEQFFKMPDKYANLARIPQKIVDFAKSTDGHNWYMPTWFAQEIDKPWPGWMSEAFWVRTDVLEKLGMKESDLATLAGLEAFLRKVKQSAPQDMNGKAVVPMGFAMGTDDMDDYKILSAFGVSTAKAAGVRASGFAAVKKVGTSIVFDVDDPGYKQGYAWISKMYREGLIDPEVVTQSQDIFRQKAQLGTYAVLPTVMWGFNGRWEHMDGPDAADDPVYKQFAPVWYLKPIPDPKVPGVAAPGALTIVNGYSQRMAFISRKTQHLDAILNFLNWSLEADPVRQQDLNEGPLGINWFWVDKPLGTWRFEPEYYKIRSSNDPEVGAKLTPQLWMWGTYSNKWYPWFTNDLTTEKKGFVKTRTFCNLIATFGTNRPVHAYDNVSAISGGVWEKNAPTLDALRREYAAKLVMAKSDAEFEQVWTTFRNQLEQKAHWTDMKKEWNQAYQAYLKEKGDY